ncbi:uncharacterized protein DUF3313 [Enterobacter sp. BIGb0383]|uniref:DUF3313 domain-containing protein n=1 Tax=unclassified Enterobacter TaxID=2608935 RepID=UPI000F49F0BB|nr:MULTISPECIES: DUF3313 domain-containing protein [unclassified Enterobacter]ROP62216.1 uncharacterized protein DUF3313 [Enterobacter sp. BIGb0383]ROS12377.1 uncharacterized protein DUF3313 [Enterobacter sp. BIGb0359]
MRTLNLFHVAALAGVLALSGCASNVTKPEQFSGFLKDYSGLQQTTSPSGKPVLRWVAPDFNAAKYDSLVFTPVSYYPVPKPTAQISQPVLDQVLSYTDNKLKTAAGQRLQLVTTPGPRSLIFRGAITGVDTSKEGLQIYEVIPVAMVVAGTQMATGHRSMDTRLFFEGELIDAATQKPVLKVVRQGEGKTVSNEKTPLKLSDLRGVIDNMATDITLFDLHKK